MHTYLTCFDIQDNRSRRYIARELERYGLRVQKSVFEITVTNDKALLRLKKRLQQWTEDGDDIRFYHLCLACRKVSHTVDNQRVAHFPKAVVL
ncbi:MAG: CRISPR-associated endonuclease Cas2 [Proteobacteria bacterium]|nr:MAG: CRISPR-associated endonuclease Cas2 [Pseudomonadota bacterium]